MPRALCNKLFCALLLALPLVSLPANAKVDRVVIIKVDGLPEGLVEHYADEAATGARSGRSRLPWIDHVFAQNGVWMENFYVRGMSLSAPSWSELDTGRHLEVRGNAEYDRYTLRVFDYLNFSRSIWATRATGRPICRASNCSIPKTYPF